MTQEPDSAPGYKFWNWDNALLVGLVTAWIAVVAGAGAIIAGFNIQGTQRLIALVVTVDMLVLVYVPLHLRANKKTSSPIGDGGPSGSTLVPPEDSFSRDLDSVGRNRAPRPPEGQSGS